MPQVLCPVLVGRDEEARWLRAVLTAAGTGRGSTVFLAGEAGIGKSRLVREVTRAAAENGLAVLAGRAVAGGAPTPFRPFAEALTSAGRAGRLPPSEELGPFRPVLGRLIPEWQPAQPVPGEESPVFLGEAVLRLLRALAPQAGCVLVLEDLHWADQESLALLEYLADNLAAERAVCLATLRDAGYEQGGEAAALASALAARGSAAVLALSRLDPAAMADMTRACLDAADLPDAVHAFVAGRAEGIPFLVEEVLAGLVREGTLTERDGRGAGRVAAAGAAAGALASAETTLTRAGDLAGPALRTSVDEALTEVFAMSGQVDRAIETGRMLLARLGPPSPRAARLHLEIARAAIAGARWTKAAASIEVARESAGADAAQIDACAAQVAAGRGRLEEADRLARAALRSAEGEGHQRVQPEVACEALEVIGRVARQRDLEAAERAFGRAADLAGAHGLRLWRLRALHELGTIDQLRTESVDRLEQARELAEAQGALALTATLDLQIAAGLNKQFRADEALAAARRSADASRRFHLATLPMALIFEATALYARLFDQAVVVGSPATDLLAETAGRLGIWLSVGVDERDDRDSTIYNTLLHFAPDGTLAARHRKLMPTGGERLVWGMGDGSTLQVVDTGFGRLGGLICWENYMPLARAALYAQGIDVYLAPTWDAEAPVEQA